MNDQLTWAIPLLGMSMMMILYGAEQHSRQQLQDALEKDRPKAVLDALSDSGATTLGRWSECGEALTARGFKRFDQEKWQRDSGDLTVTRTGPQQLGLTIGGRLGCRIDVDIAAGNIEIKDWPLNTAARTATGPAAPGGSLTP